MFSIVVSKECDKINAKIFIVAAFQVNTLEIKTSQDHVPKLQAICQLNHEMNYETLYIVINLSMVLAPGVI